MISSFSPPLGNQFRMLKFLLVFEGRITLAKLYFFVWMKPVSGETRCTALFDAWFRALQVRSQLYSLTVWLGNNLFFFHPTEAEPRFTEAVSPHLYVSNFLPCRIRLYWTMRPSHCSIDFCEWGMTWNDWLAWRQIKCIEGVYIRNINVGGWFWQMTNHFYSEDW